MEGEFFFFPYVFPKRPLFLMNSCNPHRPLQETVLTLVYPCYRYLDYLLDRYFCVIEQLGEMVIIYPYAMLSHVSPVRLCVTP